MLLDIHLGQNKNYTLTYELNDNRVAQRIGERFINNTYEYVSRTQFYNFGETAKDVKEKLDHSIEQIKKFNVHEFNDADDLNSLHVNFPNLVKNATGELRHWLSMFNYHLHHLEDITRYGNKRFLVSTNSGGPGPEPLKDSDYDLFSVVRLPNHLYMCYPHVGKHLMELFFDNDLNIPKDHIVPTCHLKNDLVAYFGEPQFSDLEYRQNFFKEFEAFCEKIKHKLPYPPGDKRLAVGHICIGKAVGDIDLHKIAQNKYVHSVEVR